MRTKLVIHIGTFKTGSTSIQNFLEFNRSYHLSRYGLYYPRTDVKPFPKARKHSHLLPAVISEHQRAQGHDISEAPTPSVIIAQLTDEIVQAQARTAVLSAEGLSSPSQRIAESYAPFGEHFDVQVLVFLRRQDLFVESLHNQFVRDSHNETRTLEEFVQSADIRAFLDYRAILKHWEKAFGRESITVVPFDNQLFEKGLLNSFLQAIGIQTVESVTDPLDNISIGPEAVELLRLLNKTPHKKNKQAVMRAVVDLGLARSKRYVLGYALRRSILDEHAAGNQEVAGRYLPERVGPLFQDDVHTGIYPDRTWELPSCQALTMMASLVCRLSELNRLERP